MNLSTGFGSTTHVPVVQQEREPIAVHHALHYHHCVNQRGQVQTAYGLEWIVGNLQSGWCSHGGWRSFSWFIIGNLQSGCCSHGGWRSLSWFLFWYVNILRAPFMFHRTAVFVAVCLVFINDDHTGRPSFLPLLQLFPLCFGYLYCSAIFIHHLPWNLDQVWKHVSSQT